MSGEECSIFPERESFLDVPPKEVTGEFFTCEPDAELFTRQAAFAECLRRNRATLDFDREENGTPFVCTHRRSTWHVVIEQGESVTDELISFDLMPGGYGRETAHVQRPLRIATATEAERNACLIP